jgi:hypothetical protein
MIGRLGLRGALAAACQGAGLGEAQAQTYTVIANFDRKTGDGPSGLTATKGRLYGVTREYSRYAPNRVFVLKRKRQTERAGQI